ncbi:hypothetical protein PV325_013310 [Microctonus aethiopoides]|uniref:Uncharacterized protein n=1 Tax=Microctonus aethiopoides TaxID=144406 RepID=A0AA39F6J4_9HYME|nr:hypothetical protein PV325_013310 [Microctonus aethiopoides]KAK0094408.1 hypothetical protein PV326_011000 [Microctonus aethiopoides]KAK0163893.1 hypothetical protein PV328_002578 [Microctonus aethiopoides]
MPMVVQGLGNTQDKIERLGGDGITDFADITGIHRSFSHFDLLSFPLSSVWGISRNSNKPYNGDMKDS